MGFILRQTMRIRDYLGVAVGVFVVRLQSLQCLAKLKHFMKDFGLPCKKYKHPLRERAVCKVNKDGVNVRKTHCFQLLHHFRQL